MKWVIEAGQAQIVKIESSLDVYSVFSKQVPINIEVSTKGDKGEKGEGVELLEQKLGNVDVDFLLHYNIAKIS